MKSRTSIRSVHGPAAKPYHAGFAPDSWRWLADRVLVDISCSSDVVDTSTLRRWRGRSTGPKAPRGSGRASECGDRVASDVRRVQPQLGDQLRAGGVVEERARDPDGLHGRPDACLAGPLGDVRAEAPVHDPVLDGDDVVVVPHQLDER